MVHELKIMPRWFVDVISCKKTFEIRRNDRDFKVDDVLFLREYNRGRYTGRSCRAFIKYIYQGDGTFGLSSDYCILGICYIHSICLDVIEEENDNKFYMSRFMRVD